jgi:hypothetical protein
MSRHAPTIVDEDKKKLSLARFKVRDVVVTGSRVQPINPLGKKEGYASPGWKWRIVKVYVDWTGRGKGNSRSLLYDVVAHDAPRYYRATIRDRQIAKKIGIHKPQDLFAQKENGT